MSGRNPIPREQAYEGVKALNPPDIIPAKRNPLPSDFKYPIGTFWINTVTQISFQLVANPGIWAEVTAAVGGPLNTLSSDAGVAAPSAGNIQIAGGLNIDTSAVGAVITVATSATPAFTSITTSGNITSTLGDITATIGDINAGGTITAGASVLAGADVSAVTSITAGTFITAGTSITSTAGDIITTDGDVIVGGAGSILSLTGAGSQIRVHGGAATDFIGSATLALGTATVLNTNIAATDRIFIQRIGAGASTALGELSYVINAGISFVINSLTPGTPASVLVTDLSVVTYLIIRQT